MTPEIKEADKIIDELKDFNPEEIETLYTQATKTTSSISKNAVQSSVKMGSRENLLLKLAELSKGYTDCLNKLKEIFNKIDDRDLKIYFEKRYLLNGYSAQDKNRILGVKYGITKSQINKICNKIEKKHIMRH